MNDHLDPWDRALLEALVEDRPLVTLAELSERSAISSSVLEALAREGLLRPRRLEPEPLYDPDDAETISAGLSILGSGLPLAELMDLARRMSEAMEPIAARAVEVFERFVRDAVTASATTDEEATARLVEAFQAMLPATGRLVDHHFRRLLVDQAEQRLRGA